MVAVKGIPQTFNGIVKMLDKCSAEHNGCKCWKQGECVTHFDKLCDRRTEVGNNKRECYRFSLWFSKLR